MLESACILATAIVFIGIVATIVKLIREWIDVKQHGLGQDVPPLPDGIGKDMSEKDKAVLRAELSPN